MRVDLGLRSGGVGSCHTGLDCGRYRQALDYEEGDNRICTFKRFQQAPHRIFEETFS